jgi:hypothetical protein
METPGLGKVGGILDPVRIGRTHVRVPILGTVEGLLPIHNEENVVSGPAQGARQHERIVVGVAEKADPHL